MPEEHACDQQHVGGCAGPLYQHRSDRGNIRCAYHVKWIRTWVDMVDRDSTLSMTRWLETLTPEQLAAFEQRVAEHVINPLSWEEVR